MYTLLDQIFEGSDVHNLLSLYCSDSNLDLLLKHEKMVCIPTVYSTNDTENVYGCI